MELSLLLRLLLAHVVGDFYLQPARWIEDRGVKQWRSMWLYIHGIVHALAAWCALGTLSEWRTVAFIGAVHVLVDMGKSYADPRGRSAACFLADQTLHVGALMIVVHWASPAGIEAVWNTPPQSMPILAIALAALGLARPVGFFVQTFTRRWDEQLGDRTDNLPGAGMWIGVIERLMVLVFVLIGAVDAIGFLLAAKSVFRFGDLRDDKDRKRTEYVLVGTLLSFSIAFFGALLARRLVHGTWT